MALRGHASSSIRSTSPSASSSGPNVILDAERCINCTRCTRFTEEVTETHQLTIVNRGDRNHPMTAPGEVFDDAYSMCTTDICPVGALTEDYFRFKARTWEMSKTPTISDFGGIGINVDVWVRNNEVVRITPRENLDVNQYWMPDVARLIFDSYNTDRLSGPRVDGQTATWAQATAEAGRLLQEAGSDVLFVGSPYATVEDNYLLIKLAEAVGAAAPRYVPTAGTQAGDDFLVSTDSAPNTAGVERLGMEPFDAALMASQTARARLVYALHPAGLEGVTAPVILHATHTTQAGIPTATVVLPTTMSVETIGTYVNETGRAQLLRPAKTIASINRSLTMAMGVGQSRTDKVGTPFDRWHDEANKVDALPGWAILPDVAERLGHAMRYKSPAAVMEEVSQQAAFAGANARRDGLARRRARDGERRRLISFTI